MTWENILKISPIRFCLVLLLLVCLLYVTMRNITWGDIKWPCLHRIHENLHELHTLAGRPCPGNSHSMITDSQLPWERVRERESKSSVTGLWTYRGENKFLREQESRWDRFGERNCYHCWGRLSEMSWCPSVPIRGERNPAKGLGIPVGHGHFLSASVTLRSRYCKMCEQAVCKSYK